MAVTWLYALIIFLLNQFASKCPLNIVEVSSILPLRWVVLNPPSTSNVCQWHCSKEIEYITKLYIRCCLVTLVARARLQTSQRSFFFRLQRIIKKGFVNSSIGLTPWQTLIITITYLNLGLVKLHHWSGASSNEAHTRSVGLCLALLASGQLIQQEPCLRSS